MYYPVLCFDERKPMAQIVIVDTMDEDSNVDGYDDAMDDLNDDDFDSGDIDVI